MRYALSLEWVGADHAKLYKVVGIPYDGPWVACIHWSVEDNKLTRTFANGITDYSEGNSVGSRGVVKRYALEPGIHEVKERTSWKNSRRYFLRVNPDGSAEELGKEEALSWTRENCWEPMY